ncbi:MAG TPA: TIGR03667 family PPOX class F420-dependent oxidoreductase [Thermomicrobiales bacterium]|nr:TIGR03667 family PPOX class F420-dependent oxidoreductase [Thermomicrobiales bacterium]
MQLDTASEFGARVARRLREETVIWLTTVRADGQPQPSPVWFLWDGAGFLIYSQPGKPKVRNIGRNPRVALHFDGNGRGGDIVIFDGEARVAPDAPPADQVPELVEKYRQGIAGLGGTPASFAREYSVAIRVTPTKVRGF